jgi:ABC-2 type transport system permease protein
MKVRNIAAVARVEWLRLIRSRVTFTLLLLVPVMQVVLFGSAIKPEAARVTIAIAAPAPENVNQVIGEIDKDQRFLRIGPVGYPGTAERKVQLGAAAIAIEIPEIRSLANPFAPIKPVRIVVDASQPVLTSAAEARIIARYWQGLAERADAGGTGIKVVRLFNPDARADWTFLPSLVGVTVMIAMIMLGSLAVSREREGGTWETMQSLPVSPFEVMLGKLLPGTLLGTVQALLVIAIALFAFDLPARGSIVALMALTPLFAVAHQAIGYAISSGARTQLAALQGAVAFYLPALLLSGFLYPFETLPRWAQTVGNLFPLSHFIRAAHGATLRADSAATVLVHGWAISAALIVASALALALQRNAR